jgi:hypothetical protein
MRGGSPQASRLQKQPRKMIMKTLMSALVAMAVLAGIAAPASATEDSHCPPGYSNVLGACFTGS